MKIVCESCQAKYSIADEKVAGKVFKIRCKKCSEVIVVHGDQAVPEEAVAQPVMGDYPADAIWHVVIDGEQQGPYVPEQIGELLANGQIDWEAYVWREGFDDWLPACDAQDLVDAIMGQAEQQPAQTDMGQFPDAAYGAAAYAEPQAPVIAPMMGEGPAVGPAFMGDDPFADNGGGMFAAATVQESGPTGDLFSPGAGPSPFDTEAESAMNDGLMASSPRVSAQQAMTGVRNENSVLFSLKNLQALATGSGNPGGSTPPAAMGATSGYAAGEGSGLIDIRALASTTGVGQEDEVREKDELLTIGAKTGAFGTLGSPMMAPSALGAEEGSRNKLILAILGGSAILAAGIVAVAFVIRPSGPTPEQLAAAAAAMTPQTDQAAGPKTQVQKSEEEEVEEEEPLSEGEKAARAAAKAAEDNDTNESSSKSRSSSSSSRHRSRSSRGSSDSSKESASASAKEASSPASNSAKPKRSTGSESLDDLLSGAISGASKRRPARSTSSSSSSDSNLPKKPSRDQVMSALRKVQPAVSSCAGGQKGVAMAQIVVASSGRVKSVNVTQVTGAVASCIARAVRGARFPQFSDQQFSVKFPFRL